MTYQNHSDPKTHPVAYRDEVVNLEESTPLIATTKRDQKREVFGLLLSMSSAVAFSLATVFVKLGGPTLPFFQIVLAQGVGQLILSYIACKAMGIAPLGDTSIAHLFLGRGAAGSISLSLFFYGITLLPIENATGNS
jgi:hypothetical protein